jgi:DNA helicase HerA-like ATPase
MVMPSREIGKIVSVDSLRVVIELSPDLKGVYKSGYYDLYQIAKINSYVVIPVAEDKVIAIITRVRINDETGLEANMGEVLLPKPGRYIVATMVGTITGEKQEYIQGIYSYPILNNPVWHIMDDDLKVIFDYKNDIDNNPVDFKNDYYLPIGTSPVFGDFTVKINPDKLFCKHAAVLGNTGCGKSCTVSTILQSLLTNKYKVSEDKEGYIKNAHFIVFDTNGEYKRAFDFSDGETNERINTFTIDNEGIRIPYWFMNYEDFDFLFKPSPGTQAPILRRAIELAKSDNEAELKNTVPQCVIKSLEKIKNLCLGGPGKEDEELREIIYENYDYIIKHDGLNNVFPFAKDKYIKKNPYIKNNEFERNYYNNARCHYMNEEVKNELFEGLEKKLNQIYDEINSVKIIQEQNVDIPKWFSYSQMIDKYMKSAISEQNGSDRRLNEYLSTLKLRLRAFFNDERFSVPFMLRDEAKSNLLSEFIQYMFGILEAKEQHTEGEGGDKEFQHTENENIFAEYKFKKCKDKCNGEQKFVNIYTSGKNNQITVIDMSLLPHEVLENIIGLIGRLILEFLSRFDRAGIKRGSAPIVIVLEEAQNYIPERDKDADRISISKKVFERIAREGRKFGLSLLISSQRPSELSKTVLSQCNTFIVHRLQNPDDQKYIRQIVSSANEDILNQLPVLPQQHAIIMGEAVRSPIQVRLRDALPKPNSENPSYVETWIADSDGDILTKKDVDKVISVWLGDQESTGLNSS